MDFGRIIKSLSPSLIAAIIGKVITSPVMFYCFVRATKKCVQLCDKQFGKAHHKNNKANAYRHALWNMLIAHHCLKVGKGLNVSLTWAKDITDWHEKAFVNNPLETHMDLHNNKKGRQWFEELHTKEPSGVNYDLMDKYLREKLQYAKKLSKNIPQDENFEQQLIYIEDYKA